MHTQNKIYSIFISAPFSLHIERDVVLRAVLETKNIPVTLESTPAATKSTKQNLRYAISESDIYIAIAGHRYGTVIEDEDGSEISFSELEFDLAKKNGVYAIALLQDFEEIKRKRNDLDPVNDGPEIDNGSRLYRYYNHLRNSADIIEYWSESNLEKLSITLTSLVIEASSYLAKTAPDKGYIRIASERGKDSRKEQDIAGEAGIVYGANNIPDGNSLLELKLFSDYFALDTSRKLFALNSLYNELCDLSGVSFFDFPLKVKSVEAGSLWIKIFGESKVISLCAKLISSAMSYVYRNYTAEGKLKTIPEKIEVVESILELSKKLKLEGQDTEKLDRKIRRSSLLIASELNMLLANGARNNELDFTYEKKLLKHNKQLNADR